MDDPERSATMSRIETKKSKEKKSILSTLPASSEELLEGTVVCHVIPYSYVTRMFFLGV